MKEWILINKKNKTMNYYKAYKALKNSEKTPRKAKKAILGKRMNKAKLNRLLDSVVVGEVAHTMHEEPDIKPYLFCPHCGCRETRDSGNLVGAPEYWSYTYCLRCGKVVGYIDNSPFVHALECKEFNYDPVF